MSSSFAKSCISNAIPFIFFCLAYYIDHKFKGAAMYPAYLVAILWAGSRWGMKVGLVFAVLSSGLSTPMSPLLGWKQNTPYLDIFFGRALVLSLLTIFYCNYISLNRINKKHLVQLKSVIPQCPDCGALYCRDGKWRPLEQLVSDPQKFGVMPIHDCNSSKQITKP